MVTPLRNSSVVWTVVVMTVRVPWMEQGTRIQRLAEYTCNK